MNGFKDDVISILSQNHYLQKESLGWIVSDNAKHPDQYILKKELEKMLVPFTMSDEKMVTNYDFIVIDKYHSRFDVLLRAFTRLSENGIIVLEVTDYPRDIKRTAGISKFGKFSITRVTFQDRGYLVIKSGVDYGD